jgi:DNA-binding NarL/FixJ family response regulator
MNAVRSTPAAWACRGTCRQFEVLQLICNGLSNPAIAATLGISVNTVAVHRANIMGGLAGVAN